ncbi:hypothetical protein [Rothia nasimurium]|uniref:hypothetical protein n=1 Tax=Rothia nasimurium TaxID=85336 RepID=UPI001F2DB819|nr:hypothetical protein [Rothia nasimurium]
MFEIASPASLILNKYSRGHVFDFVGSGVEIPAGFEEKYDFHTFAYHAYWNTAGDKAILICPPFGNFRDTVKLGDQKIALTDADSEYLTVYKYPRYYRVEVAEELLDARGQLPVYVNDSEAYSLKIQDNISDLFRDLKILHTLQKDNNLEWIYDWVKYYISVHEIDAVVIFDNGSTKYSIEEIKETVISAGNGKLKKVIIFDWDFPYGPAMSPWTSFFLQPSTFAVAHEYIYQYADFVVNTDIDEYILESDTSLSQALDESGTGSLVIHGHWIENIPLPGAHLEESSSPRVWQFGYFNPTRLNSGKWVSRPQDLNDPTVHFSEHWISGRSLTADPRFRVAHFTALTSGWFDPSRKDQMQLDDTLRIDPLLIKSLKKAFPEKMPESTRLIQK